MGFTQSKSKQSKTTTPKPKCIKTTTSVGITTTRIFAILIFAFLAITQNGIAQNSANVANQQQLVDAILDTTVTIINFTANITLTTTPAGGIAINNNRILTINGNGWEISGNVERRILNVTTGAKVTINNLTLKDGYTATPDFFSDGAVRVSDAGTILTANNYTF